MPGRHWQARPPAAAIFVILVVLCTWRYWKDPVFFTAGYDSTWAVPAALRIAYHHDTRLDSYAHLLKIQEAHATDHVGAHYYNWYPVAVPLLASPFVWLEDQYERLRFHTSLEGLTEHYVPTWAEHRVAAVITALGVSLFFLVGRRELTLPRALLWTALYAFGTSVWSTASKALWQHTVSLPLVVGVIYSYGRAERDQRWLLLTGFLAGLSYEVRSTNLLTVLLFAGLIGLRYRSYLLGYGAAVLVAIVPFLFYHQEVYGSWWSPYQILQRHLVQWPFPTGREAMLGTLVSPNRGLFVYTPVLSFCGVGLVERWREKQYWPEAAGMALVIVGQWLGISLSLTWWGGYCFGPRLLSDILPYCFMLLIPAVRALQWTWRPAHIAYAASFLLAGALSVWIHYRGANVMATYWWDNGPPSVDARPGRIWMWNDMQILRRDGSG